MNGIIVKLARQLSVSPDGPDEDKYREQLNMIYGALAETNVLTPAVYRELAEIEQNRISEYGKAVESRVTSPETLLMEYSNIGFAIAQRSLKEGTVFQAAACLRECTVQLFSSLVFSENERKELRKTVSETELDFAFAAGNHKIASLRMAPIIRDYQSRNGGEN